MTSHGDRQPAEQRETARRVLEAVPDERVSAALHALRELAGQSGDERPRRRFRIVGVFDDDMDLGARAKDIVRDELGGTGKSA